MRTAKGKINVDKLKICFKANESLLDNLMEEFKTTKVLDFVDYQLVLVEQDEDSMLVALDMDMDGAFFISGLNLENARVGDRISPELKNILSSLSELQEKYPELCSLISEVKIEKRDYGDYELVLYPVYTPIPVRTKGILTERVLRYVILVLDIVEGFDIKIEELDFRSGTVAYRSKEGR